ncbi:NUDIX domain-containing protein [Rothia sp. ARF10]|nr:NUDIX domain-containing protein [Rothia sp. ARF10]
MTGGLSTEEDQPAQDVAVASDFAHLHADVLRVLGAWTPPDAGQERLRTAYLAHLEEGPATVAKAGVRDHLTASCLVITPDAGHVLLTHHRRAREWFQFGGHLESSDPTLLAAATREGREESGIADVTPDPVVVQLDHHELGGDFGWCRSHLDVRFAAIVDREAVPVTSAESLDVAWWPTDGLPKGSRDEISALVAATRRSLGL